MLPKNNGKVTAIAAVTLSSAVNATCLMLPSVHWQYCHYTVLENMRIQDCLGMHYQQIIQINEN